jgi:hypothetical protein
MKLRSWLASKLFSPEIRKNLNAAITALQKKALGSFFNPQPIFFPPRRLSAFRTWHERPVYARNVSQAARGVSGSDVAIVLQGKVVEKSSFTLETVEIYRKLYPQAQIILSTWNSTKPETVHRARALGATVLLTDEPLTMPGHANVDLQILSTVQGLREARRLGAKYGLKTRTDQRMYNPMALDLMQGLLASFAPNREHSDRSQLMRILVTDLGTFKFRLYSMSDFLHFGLLEDLEKIWNVEALRKLDGVALSSPPEVFICSHFIQSIGRVRANSLQDWWSFVRDNLIVVDASSLDLFWPKYTSREYRWRQYDGPKTHNQFSFADWMSLQSQVVVDPEGIDQALF